jgi:Uma2 family endonuclease
VVHPEEQTVLVYIRDASGKYQGKLKPYTRQDKLQPVTLPELIIDLEEVFPEQER